MAVDRGNLPDGIIIWQIEQDHLDPDLLFIGAENGLWASLDRGTQWHRLKGWSATVGGRFPSDHFHARPCPAAARILAISRGGVVRARNLCS